MLVDRRMTVGRASVAWQENRPHITGLHQDMLLSLANTDIRNEAHTWPTSLHNLHMLTQTGKTPLEVSLCEGGFALLRAYFSQADPGEREWIEEMWGQGHSLEVELSDRETRTANVIWASNAHQTKTSFKVFSNAARCGEVKRLCEVQLEWGLQIISISFPVQRGLFHH